MADESPERPETRASPADEKTFTFRKTFKFRSAPPEGADVEVVPGTARSFEWHIGTPDADSVKKAEGAVPPDEARTYYEMLTGRRDPMGDFLVSARRTLNIFVTVVAVAIPIGLIVLGIVAHADAQTIAVMGVAGLVVGAMLKSTFPRTPFG